MTGETIHDEELERLMNQVGELLECQVVCMILRDTSGELSVACPKPQSAEVLSMLRGTDWSKVGV